MGKISVAYIMFNVIYIELFIIFVCGNEAFMIPWWITLIAAVVPAIITLIGTLAVTRKSQIAKNTEEIQKLARQLGVNDEETFHNEFSKQYKDILSEIQNNIGKTPNDKALTGQHHDMLNTLQKDFQTINSRYEKEDENYRSFTMQQKDLKETLDNFSRDYAKVISENKKLLYENIDLKSRNEELETQNQNLQTELAEQKGSQQNMTIHR